VKEPVTIGLTDVGQQRIQSLKHDPNNPGLSGPFLLETEAFLFAMALALQMEKIADRTIKTKTKWRVDSVDPDGRVYELVRELRSEEDQEESVWRTAVRLADWGLEELERRASGGSIQFGKIFEELGGLEK